MTHLSVLAWQFHVAFAEIAQPMEPRKERIELSNRERDCLRWTAEGKSSWDIGMILNISDNTVKNHIRNVLEKLQLHSRMEAVMYAMKEKLLDVDTNP